MEKSPTVACPNKYSLIQTILNPLVNTPKGDKVADNLQESVLSASVSVKKSGRLQDERQFVCVLQAPYIFPKGANIGTSYMDKDSLYGLVIKPMNFDSTHFPGLIETKIFIDFGKSISQSKLSTALSNWSILSQQMFTFNINSSSSILNESVHDLFQNSCDEANLIWSPDKTKEVKLMLKFNVESSKLARFAQIPDLNLNLIVQTSEMTSDSILDQSECKVSNFACLFKLFEFIHLFYFRSVFSVQTLVLVNFKLTLLQKLKQLKHTPSWIIPLLLRLTNKFH